MTLSELQSSKRVSILHSAGYTGQASSNALIVRHAYKVVYTRPSGERLIIGQAANRNIEKARAAALAAALQWANE